MKAMKCRERLLSVVCLLFGLVAVGALGLAVATDYWIFTSEPFTQEIRTPVVSNNNNDTVIEQDSGSVDLSLGYYDLDGHLSNYSYTEYKQYTMLIKCHSGLWRMCISGGKETLQCETISYVGQGWRRMEDLDTTWSILRAIRKSSPVIVFSLMLLFTGLVTCTLGNTKRDNKTLIGAVIYVFAALCLAVGVILYISAVNDEVAHKKKPNPDGTVFEYHYGWAFFFAGSAFVTSLLAAVANISLYLRRFPTIEDMVTIIPGLDKKHPLDHSKDFSDLEPETSCSQNPTIIF